MPSDVILEGLHKSKIQESAQLKTVLALYDQDTLRNGGETDDHQLKRVVKLHIEQTMRARNFKVRNDVVERGSVSKGQTGKKVESTWAMFQRRLM